MKEIPDKVKIVLLLTLCLFICQGCFLTKVVTVPMRVGGAVVSVIPVAGNSVHDSIDEAAKLVDKVPI